MLFAASASERSRLGFVGFTGLAVLAAAQLGASCVDGVTPDCSDPTVCAPNAGNAGDASAMPEGGGRNDSSVPDANAGLDAETSADADADGG